MGILRRMFWDLVCFVELLVSTVVHATYALNIFLSAVWIDFMSSFTSSPQESARIAPVIEADENETDNRERSSCVMVRSESDERNLGYAGSFMEGHEKAPIVLVHGIFGFGAQKLGKISYWGGAEKRDDRIFAPDLGALSSIYDSGCCVSMHATRGDEVFAQVILDQSMQYYLCRWTQSRTKRIWARELFYYLKGGTVDYGVERSEKYGHSRFGHTYHQGHYPDWDSKHPIHFVGHSTGAQVVRLLQNMLADKAFPGHEGTSADWVLSITALSGALNGTTRVYYDGIRPEDGRSMKSVSLLQVLRVAVLLYEWLDIPVLKRYYDFGFDHYNLQWHKAGIRGLIDTLSNRSGPFVHGNWVVPDLSIHSAVQLNKKLRTFDKTFYFSYATKGTKKWFSRWTLPGSILGTHPLLFIRSLQISLWRHPQELRLPYEGYRDEDWLDNDGALNTISQLYPCVPYEHPNCELGTDLSGLKDGQVLHPGIWYYTTLVADHIFFVINRERAGVHFDVLYDNIFQRCRKQLRPSSKSS